MWNQGNPYGNTPVDMGVSGSAPGGWGVPPPQNGGWGTPAPPAGGWGAPPPQPTGTWGAAPPQPTGNWGAPPPQPTGNWGAPPPQPTGNWGAPPPQPTGNWGAPPPQPTGNWGAPPPQQPGWGGAPVPQPTGNWGAPPQQPGWGGAPPQQPGWGGAPPQQPGWGGAPPPQQGWGGAPPQQPGWGGAPPPQSQQPGWGGAPHVAPVRVGEGGNKRAVLVGINYIGHQKGQLRGCINDVHNIRRTLEKFGFTGPNVKVMTDDLPNPHMLPTKANILRELRWLTANVQPGDSLFFHFSGHGSQVVDQNGDEDDGLDETILPMDYNKAGQIIDDDLNMILVQTIPPGAKLTALMDCCHSGTGMDLPFVHVPSNSGRIMKKDKKKKKKKKGKSYSSGTVPGGSRGDVVLFSGCRDDQTGADASINGQATGAMTWAFTTCLERNPNNTYDGFLCAMRDLLNGGGGRTFSQVPQLSTGREMDLHTPFRL